jgi:hypothetical protein
MVLSHLDLRREPQPNNHHPNMSTNANALANLLYSYTFQQDGVTPVSVANASSSEQQWLALAITQAIQEMHGIKPDAWRQRPGITLSAPIAGTATVTFGSTACSLGTLTVPNDGCTVRFSSGIDNELNSNGSGGYVLRRPHDGESGTLTATLWQDCWVAADGTQYENVLGDVLANEVPIVVARTMKEVEMCRWRYPWRDYGAGNLQTRLRFAGRVLAVVFEPWTSPFTSQMQTRLRFTPMPAAQTVIDANLQVAAQVITAADILADGVGSDPAPVTFWTPAGLDESILTAIALQKWTISPFFRTDSARKGIDLQYTRAVDRLRDFRGHQEAMAGIEIRGW